MDKRFFYSTKTATGDTNCLNVNSVLVFVFSVVFHVARKFYFSSQSHSPLQKRQRREPESFSSGRKSTEIKKNGVFTHFHSGKRIWKVAFSVTFHQKTCERKANPHLPRPQSHAISFWGYLSPIPSSPSRASRLTYLALTLLTCSIDALSQINASLTLLKFVLDACLIDAALQNTRKQPKGAKSCTLVSFLTKVAHCLLSNIKYKERIGQQ